MSRANLAEMEPQDTDSKGEAPSPAIPDTSQMGKRVVGGLFWMAFQSVGAKLVSMGTQIVLAWLLATSDFGQIGLAYTVTAFVNLMVNPGIEIILVQRGRRFDLWATPAFHFSLVTGILGGLVVLALAPAAAWIYDTPPLIGLLSVLAIATPLGVLSTVPLAALRHRMQFRAIAMVGLGQIVLQMTLTIMFAAAGFGAYSFVLPMPLVYLVSGLWYWLIARPQIRAMRPLRYWNYFLADSAYLFSARFLLTIVGQGDYVILGLLHDDAVVGVYYFGFLLAVQALRLVAGNIAYVLQPAFVRLESGSRRQVEAAERSIRATGILSFLACVLQAFLARPLMTLLFGDKWLDSIFVVQVLSIGLGMEAVSWGVAPLIFAQGKYRLWCLSAIPLVLTFIILALIGASWGATGMAIAVATYYSICITIWTLTIGPRLGLRIARLWRLYRDMFTVAFFPGLSVVMVLLIMPHVISMSSLLEYHNEVLELVVVTTVFVTTAMCSIRTFASDVWTTIISSLSSIWTQMAARVVRV
jgi:PST family polysaccharide transporter